MGMSDLETYIQAMRKDVTGDVLSRSQIELFAESRGTELSSDAAPSRS